MNKDFNEFDKMAQDAFEGFEVDYNPEDWERMESKLDKKEHLMPYIWLFKGVEAIVLLLFLFTAVNFWFQQGGDQTVLAAQEGASEAKSLQEVNKESNSHKMAADENTQTENPTHTETDYQENAFEITNQDNSSHSTYQEATVGKTSAQNVNNKERGNIMGTKAGNIANLDKSAKATEKQKALANSSTTTKPEFSLSTDKEPLAISEHTSNDLTAADKVKALSDKTMDVHPATSGIVNNPATLNTNTINTTFGNVSAANNKSNDLTAQRDFTRTAKGYLLSDNTVDPVDASKNPIRPKGGRDEGSLFNLADLKFPELYHRQTRLGVFAAADMNFRSETGDNSLGMSLGVLMEHEISKPFSFSYGIIGTRKNFEDYYVEYIDRTASEGVVYRAEIFKRTSLATLQIPAYFNVHAIRSAKWKVGVSLGGAVEVLTGRYAIGSQRTAVNQQAGGLVVVSELNSRSEDRGFFQGGSIKDNSVFMLGGGLNLERKLSDRVSLSLQPRYHHAMGNFGTDANRIHNFSVNVGIQTVIR